jgi:hypothetical protein
MREKEKRERERERRKKREREESEKVTELREVTPRHNPHRCFLIRQIKTFSFKKKTFFRVNNKIFLFTFNYSNTNDDYDGQS